MTDGQVDVDAARRRLDAAIEDHEQVFERFFLARFLALEFEYGDDFCRVSFPVETHLFNPQGSLHGGVIATVMDISMGHLIKHSTGRPGATLEMKTQYLKPVTLGRANCEGRFLRRGRSVGFLESRLWRDDGDLAVFASSTWALS
jgi:uncharacterized protein (TIGR00369 family)